MDNSVLGRQLPYSMEAEQAVLGSILLDSEKYNEITGLITAEDFYVERHRDIFAAVRDLFFESRTIDPVTVLNSLVEKGIYSEQSGALYFKQLADSVPAISNLRDYAVIVRDKALLRRLISASEEINRSAYEQQGEDTQAILDAAEQKIFALAQGFVAQDFSHIKDIIVECYNQLNQLKNNKEAMLGTPTYFGPLDRYLVGLGAGDLVLIGARPGMGKTSFAMNIAARVARNQKKAVAVFSLEMSKVQIVNRMLSSEGRIDSYKLRSGDLGDEDYDNLAKASVALSNTDIYIDDTSGISVSQMKAKLRRIKNLGLVVVDYLQLMQSELKSDNRVAQVGEISRGLKIMAKDLQVPLICCAQLSRGPESRTDKTPQLSDLRESGSIEQDADIVMFLYRDDYYNTGKEENDSGAANTVKCIIAKNRHGSTGTVTFGWEAPYTRFTEIDERHSEGF